jgi:hypothetical protein
LQKDSLFFTAGECLQIVFWLAYIKLELGAMVGPFSLDYLKLDPVIAGVPVDDTVRQRRFFGILS